MILGIKVVQRGDNLRILDSLQRIRQVTVLVSVDIVLVISKMFQHAFHVHTRSWSTMADARN